MILPFQRREPVAGSDVSKQGQWYLALAGLRYIGITSLPDIAAYLAEQPDIPLAALHRLVKRIDADVNEHNREKRVSA